MVTFLFTLFAFPISRSCFLLCIFVSRGSQFHNRIYEICFLIGTFRCYLYFRTSTKAQHFFFNSAVSSCLLLTIHYCSYTDKLKKKTFNCNFLPYICTTTPLHTHINYSTYQLLLAYCNSDTRYCAPYRMFSIILPRCRTYAVCTLEKVIEGYDSSHIVNTPRLLQSKNCTCKKMTITFTKINSAAIFARVLD